MRTFTYNYYLVYCNTFIDVLVLDVIVTTKATVVDTDVPIEEGE